MENFHRWAGVFCIQPGRWKAGNRRLACSLPAQNCCGACLECAFNRLRTLDQPGLPGKAAPYADVQLKLPAQNEREVFENPLHVRAVPIDMAAARASVELRIENVHFRFDLVSDFFLCHG